MLGKASESTFHGTEPRGDATQAFGSRPTKDGQWSQSALRVLRERYLVRDATGGAETPEEMCWRVAVAIAKAEEQWGRTETEARQVAESFYEMMVEGKFLPNSPTMMNAGKDNGLQYSACFVLPVDDSIEGIFEAVQRAAIIHQSGGGTGFAFSRLRPKDTLVKSTGGKASGPISFLRVFNAATEAVKQGGARRGANMGILKVDHPDILEFIDCKLDGGITNFNISVAATETFMDALEKDETYELIDPHTKLATGHLQAREVFQRIVQAAWRSGDPGMIFIDRINASPANPIPQDELIEATNPCGEQPLGPNDACNLGSINLARYYLPSIPADAGTTERIDWVEMEQVVRTAVRFLDDVIDVNPYPLQDITEEVGKNRRIGLGVMGWADLLLELGIPYDSEEAVTLGEGIMGFIRRIGHDASEKLAEARGPFPRWSRSIYKSEWPLRNSTVTTIAPTGTISIIVGCSSGIEPIFAVAFRHIVGDRHLTFVNPIFEEVAKRRGFYSEELMRRVAERGAVRGLEGVPEDVQRVFGTAHEIEPAWHVRMQAAFQHQTDNGVSKTINLPNSATPDDIAKAYMMAYELGCLGITVFRDGCKDTQVLHIGTGAQPAVGGVEEVVQEEALPSLPTAEEAGVEGRLKVKPRPRTMKGVTYRAETPLGTAFITVNQNGEGEPFEVFASVGKAGSNTSAVSEAIGRLISLVMRLPSPMSPRGAGRADREPRFGPQEIGRASCRE